MIQYTNNTGIPLSLGVFLASDYYDYCDDPYTISVTTLLKPLRQIILPRREEVLDKVGDLSMMINNRMGAAIHDGVERAWLTNHAAAMKAIGYPQRVIDRVVVNPPPGTDLTNKIPVYLEQRATRKVGRWTVSGKFDFVGDGRVEDVKTTSVFTAIYGTNDDKYVQQGSIYRWLNPKIITADEMAIQWLFTDWSAASARSDPKYPQSRHVQKIFKLMSVDETNRFIERKLALIDKYLDAPEDQIPHCTDEELWRSDPQFKYYKNPEKTSRSTKNFDTYQDAMLRYVEDGSVGMVKEVPGQVKACKYCASFLLCSQKDLLIERGELVLDGA